MSAEIDEQLIERVARRICESFGHNSDELEHLSESMRRRNPDLGVERWRAYRAQAHIALIAAQEFTRWIFNSERSS